MKDLLPSWPSLALLVLSKPKRRLLDNDVSDDESDEENGMDELARKYLCVPADTNTQAERVFS